MIGIILEALVLLVGLVILVTGRATLSRRIVLSGPEARAVGLWMMLFVPLSFSLHCVLQAHWLKSLPAGRMVISSLEFPVTYLLLAVFVPIVFVALVIYLIHRGMKTRTQSVHGGAADTAVAREGEELGVFKDASIQYGLESKELLPSDHFYREGMPEWLTLAQWSPRIVHSSGPLWLAIASIFVVLGVMVGSSTYLVLSTRPGLILDGKPLPTLFSLTKPDPRRAPEPEPASPQLSAYAPLPGQFTPAPSEPSGPKPAPVLPFSLSGIQPPSTPLPSSSGKSDDQFEETFRFGMQMAQEVVNGSSPDMASAQRKLAEQGNAIAQYELGMNYLVGKNLMAGGAPFTKDPNLAVEWIHKAARQGHPTSQLFMSGVMQSGETGRKSIPEAWAWMTLYLEKASDYRKEELVAIHHKEEQAMSASERQEGEAYLAKLRSEGVR